MKRGVTLLVVLLILSLSFIFVFFFFDLWKNASPSECGDGVCSETETSYNCPEDCGHLAYFKFEVKEETFIIQLTDSQKIQIAREILNNNTLRDNRHIRGKIIKEQVPYNSPWVYHLDPGSVSFFEMSIEVCDGAIEQINENIIAKGDTFLPNDSWCPWRSKLIEELDCENEECSNEVEPFNN